MTVIADARSWSRFYVPEIHDVHPGMETSLDTLLDALPEEARARAALLLVPDWRGCEPLARDAPFCSRLRRHSGEIVLHGWNHSLGPSWWNWLYFGHDNRSEFAGLSHAQAAERLRLGRDMVGQVLGFVPRWFCAPRWQQNAATAAAVREAGFLGYHLQKRIQFCSGESMPLTALCFDEGERRLKIAVERRLRAGRIERLLESGRPFRLTLHPSDPRFAKTWEQAKGLIARLKLQGWTALSLDEAQARWQQASSPTGLPG